MKMVYLRIVIYVLTTVATAIPASWAGYVVYHATAAMAPANSIVISVDGLAGVIVSAIMLSTAIFAKWGDKRP